jgi:hypothetical protein
MKNLWPTSINVQHQLTPKDFLVNQAEFLGISTNGKVIGNVSTYQTDTPRVNPAAADLVGDVFIHTLTVKAPALKYTFSLLSYAHATLKIFPVHIYSSLTGEKYIADNIEEVENFTGIIFNMPEIMNSLRALIIQSPDK